ncbi:MAG: DUF4167 domain-containing protein [Pseudomonadota bacterium]
MRQGQQQNRQRSRNRNNNRSNNNNNNNNNARSQLNRSMESNGPDVRIRGTAAHISEKYMQLARDATTAGDTVAAESYWQHAEHYNRLIAVAQATIAEEQAKRDEERARRQEARGESRGDSRGDARGDVAGEDSSDANTNADGEDDRPRRGRRNRKDQRDDERSEVAASSVKDDGHDTEATNAGDGPQPVLEGTPAEVELKATPTTAAVDKDAGSADDAPKPRRTRRRVPAAESEIGTEAAAAGHEDAKPAKVAKPRKPRAPKAAKAPSEDAAALPAFLTGE